MYAGVFIKVNNIIFYIYIYLSFKRLKDALHQGKKGGMKRGMFGRWKKKDFVVDARFNGELTKSNEGGGAAEF